MRLTAKNLLALALLALVACSEGQRSQGTKEVVLDVEAVAPAFERPLLADDGTLLSARDVVATSRGLLVLDASSGEIWQVGLEAPHSLVRMSRPTQFGQADVFAMTSHSAGLSVIGIDGSLRVMQPLDADKIARTIRAFQPIHRPLALGEWPSSRWVAVHAILVLRDAPLDSVIVSVVDSAGRVERLYALERVGPARTDAFVRDRVGARALRGRVVLTGADPARVITVTSAGVHADTLLEVPMRPLNTAEQLGLERMLDGPGAPAAIRGARRPTHRPAALSALPIDGGYLVVAQGGQSEQYVDLYCGRSFRRTVLARERLHSVFIVDGGIVAIVEPADAASERPQRLLYYASEDFSRECAT